MSKQRKQFTLDFKLKAVELSYQRDNIKELANELDKRPALLYRWRSEFASHQGSFFPGNGNRIMSEEELEIASVSSVDRTMTEERFSTICFREVCKSVVFTS